MKKFLTILGIILSLSGFFVSSAHANFNDEVIMNAPRTSPTSDGVSLFLSIILDKEAKDTVGGGATGSEPDGIINKDERESWKYIKGPSEYISITKTDGSKAFLNKEGFIATVREIDINGSMVPGTEQKKFVEVPITSNQLSITSRFDGLKKSTTTQKYTYEAFITGYDNESVGYDTAKIRFETRSDSTVIGDTDQDIRDASNKEDGEDNGDIGNRCTLLKGATGLVGCIADLMYNVIFVDLSLNIAWIGGKFVDLLFNYSIQSSSYNASNFINTGWGVVRDVCNLSFIFILLYAAVGLIIGQQNTAGIKKTIGMVIVVGVLINFSLFFTKIFIDTGNIMARVFYNSIETSIVATDGTTRTVGKNGEKEITAALMSKIDPLTLVGPEMSEDLPNGYVILIALVGTAVNLIAAWMFLSIGLMFVSRVVELWLKMIFSPVAFISLALPSGLSKKLNDYGWEKWLGGLMGLAFMPAIFMFFLYLITMFVDAKIVISFSKDADIPSKILSVLIPFAIILGLLGAAKKATEAAKGQISSMVTSVAGTATGLAVGAATGGLAMLGRATIGSYASKQTQNQSLKEKATQKGLRGYAARTALKAANFGSKSSFDARNTTGGSLLSKNSGINFDNKTLGAIGLDTKSGAGGFEGQAEKTKKERVKYFEDNLELKGGAIKAQDERAKEYQKHLEEEKIRLQARGQLLNEEKFREEYEKGQFETTDKDGERVKIKKGSVDTANAVNTNRRKEYADTLETGSNALSSTVYQAFRLLTDEKDAASRTSGINTVTGIMPGNPTGDRRAAAEITKKIGDDTKVDAEIEKVDKVLKTIENSLTNVVKEIHKNPNGQPLSDDEIADHIKNLSSENLKEYTRKRKVELNVTQNKLDSKKKAASNPNATKETKDEYAALLNEKISMEEEIAELKDIFDKKEKLEEKKGNLAKKKTGDKKPDEKKDDEKK